MAETLEIRLVEAAGGIATPRPPSYAPPPVPAYQPPGMPQGGAPRGWTPPPVPQPPPGTQAGQPPLPTALPIAQPVAPQLRIIALKRSMLEVRSAKGDKYVHRYYNPGEFFVVRVGAGFTVSAEDGAAFEWRLGDQSLGLLQETGGPVFSPSVDQAAQRPPIVIAPPVIEPVASDTDANVLAIPGQPATGASPAPAPAKPRPRPAKPPATANATTSAPPAATTPAPVQPPVRDPALDAYPDQVAPAQ